MRLLIAVFISSLLMMEPLLSSEKLIHPQPLTQPLPARAGKRVVTPDWLLSLPNRTEDYPTIVWLDNSKIIYSSPPSLNKKGWTIELWDVSTNEHKILGKGLHPKASPDDQLIAFVKGEKNARFHPLLLS